MMGSKEGLTASGLARGGEFLAGKPGGGADRVYEGLTGGLARGGECLAGEPAAGQMKKAESGPLLIGH